MAESEPRRGLFTGLTRAEWITCIAAFVAGVALCTAALSFAQPTRSDCPECINCL